MRQVLTYKGLKEWKISNPSGPKSGRGRLQGGRLLEVPTVRL